MSCKLLINTWRTCFINCFNTSRAVWTRAQISCTQKWGLNTWRRMWSSRHWIGTRVHSPVTPFTKIKLKTIRNGLHIFWVYECKIFLNDFKVKINKYFFKNRFWTYKDEMFFHSSIYKYIYVYTMMHSWLNTTSN